MIAPNHAQHLQVVYGLRLQFSGIPLKTGAADKSVYIGT